MIDVLLGIFAGLGLFFVGMRLLSTHLKQSAGNRVRMIAARLARHRLLMMLLGAGAGAATQSTNAVTAAATGLATAQIISIREAFPLIACANIGTSVLVFLAAVDFHAAILAAAGACGLLFYLKLDQSPRHRAYVGAALAFVLILFGLDMVGEAAKGLRADPTLRGLFASLSGLPVAAFLVGAALVPVLQTAKTVAVVVAVLAQSGTLGPVEAVAAVIGANLTSAANVAFLTSGVSPMGRALGTYQAVLKVIGSGLALVALAAVLWVRPDLVATVDTRQAPFLVAVAYLVMQVGAYAVALAAERPIADRLSAMVARQIRDDPAEPRFISRAALLDPATATELAFKEHLDIVEGLATGLDRVRHDQPVSRPAHRDWPAIAHTLGDFLDALADRAEDEGIRRRTASLQRLHNLVLGLQPQIERLAENVARSGSDPAVSEPMAMMVESAHALLELFGGTCRSRDAFDRAQMTELTADRTPVTERIRLAVMSKNAAGVEVERDLFDCCITFERIIWLIRRYLLLSDEPGSPYLDIAADP
ncbi:hypothetical protein [Stella sp.]|uniref:hypothetical protein n=1 Tax=Stella sp. TaxID=2912054 RepID=UPI0035AD9195